MRRDGTVGLLAGNLEEGLRDDADRVRTLDLALPTQWAECDWRAAWPGVTVVPADRRLTIALAPQGSTLLTCTPIKRR